MNMTEWIIVSRQKLLSDPELVDYIVYKLEMAGFFQAADEFRRTFTNNKHNNATINLFPQEEAQLEDDSRSASGRRRPAAV